MHKLYIIIIVIFLTGCSLAKPVDIEKKQTPVNQTKEKQQIEISLPIDNKELVLPVKEFKQRITKKPFGVYITPQTSPVQPERFSGYHTGIDVEYDDVIEEVLIYAITDGQVVESRFVGGYGGLVAIKHNINEKNYLALYGHLDPKSIIKKGQTISKDEQIGVLGDGFTAETDGERKHLHFAIYTNNDLNLRGYVQSKDELKNWLDPLTLY